MAQFLSFSKVPSIYGSNFYVEHFEPDETGLNVTGDKMREIIAPFIFQRFKFFFVIS